MTLAINPHCNNCFEEIRWPPTMWDGESYCCDGCVMGGPCVCTYSGPPPKLDISKILKAVGLEISSAPLTNVSTTLECENCFEIFERQPYYFDGKPYCCEGCTQGGPCLCSYDGAPLGVQESATPDEPIGSEKSTSVQPADFTGKFNDLWQGSSEHSVKPLPEMVGYTRVNRFWRPQNEDTLAAEVEPLQENQAKTIPDGEVAEDNVDASGNANEEVASPARTERFNISVSPLNEVRDVRRFIDSLETIKSVQNVMLTYYAGNRATFDVESDSMMTVIKGVMGMDSFNTRSLRVMSEGLEVNLTEDDEEVSRVQLPAKELLAASLTGKGLSQQDTLPESGSKPADRLHAKERVGDEGELHTFKYEMGVDVFFNGRHQVEIADVKGPVHMHSWRVQAILQGESSSESGKVVGSDEVRDIISELVTPWNDKMLNKTPPFDDIMPTVNNIARVVYEHVAGNLQETSVRMKAVRLWESPTSYVEFSGEA